MDLASLTFSIGGEVMTLRHPITREPILTDDKPVTFRVIGRDHPDFRDHMRKKQDKKLAATVREVPTSAALEAEYAENLSALVKDWDGLVVDGQPVKFSPDAARRLLSDPRFPWIAEQVDEFTTARANFIKASA